MTEIKLEKTADNVYTISGELNYQSVPALLKQSFNELNGVDHAVIDMSKVSRSDSAGVALLIEWQRLADKRKQTINFMNIPAQMRVIAQLSGVDKILAIT